LKRAYTSSGLRREVAELLDPLLQLLREYIQLKRSDDFSALMFHVFSFRPWNRTYATGCVISACRATTFEARVIGVSTGHVREARALEELERRRPLARLHPRAVPELDERDERCESCGDELELRECRPSTS
jgi:hypothetical protein